MTWINTIKPEEAEGELARVYRQVSGPAGQVDNILKAHSLRLHSLRGHMALYKNVLHHSGNEVPKWLLEALGVYVSLLNQCDYCVHHHRVGMAREINDGERSAAVEAALRSDSPSDALDPAQAALFDYARTLTLDPSAVTEAMIDRLLNSASRDDFLAAARALDRVLTTGRYVIPIYQWNISRIAHAKELRFPEQIPMYGDWIGWQPDVWWYEEG